MIISRRSDGALTLREAIKGKALTVGVTCFKRGALRARDLRQAKSLTKGAGGACLISSSRWLG